jgi:precorrin-3B C17-methyltransferase
MVTPRGYTNKYEWDGTVRDGQRPGYSLVLPREEAPLSPAASAEEE